MAAARVKAEFPLDAPIPYALVASIEKLRVKQNLAKVRKK